MSIGLARLASRGSRAREALARLFGELRQFETGAGTGVGAEDPKPARIRQDGDPAAARQRLAGEQHRDVGELLERVGADHARLPEQRVDRGRRARERGRVGAGGALAGGRPAALHRQDRLLPRDPPRDARELARVAERLQVEEDEIGARVVLPVLEQVVGGDVRLVPDGDEGREAQAARGRLLEQREAERAALRGEADVPGGEASAARRSRSGRPPRRRCPRQFGPTRRAPWARTSASSSSWRRMPSIPVSANPAEITQSARVPLPQRRLCLGEHGAPGTQKTARSTSPGMSAIDG